MLNWRNIVRFWNGDDIPPVPLESELASQIFGRSPTDSGVMVSELTVLSYPAFYRAVNLISDYVGKLPIDIYKWSKNGGSVIDYDQVAYEKLKRPNAFYGKYLFFKTLTAQAIWNGNGYAFIPRDEFARPVDDWLILDPLLTIPYIFLDGSVLYQTTVLNQSWWLSPADVIHIKGLSRNGIAGYCLYDLAREALGLGLALQRYGAVYFKNNASPKLVVEMPGHLTGEEQIKKFRASWSEEHQGLYNAHKVSVLEDGASVKPITVSNDEAQFLQSRQHEIATTVASLTGVPPHKLGVAVGTSYGSLEQENKSLLNDCIDPWLVQWEEELNYKLLTEYQKKVGSHYCQFDRRQLERADSKTENDILLAKLNNGAITQTQYNEMTNQPSEGEDWENFHRITTTTQFVETLLEEKEAKLEAIQNPPDVQRASQPQTAADVVPSGQEALPDASSEANREIPNKEQSGTGAFSSEGDRAARFDRLLDSDLARFVRRLETAAAKKGTEDLSWLASHRKVFRETFSDVFDDLPAVEETFFADMVAVLRDKVAFSKGKYR